MKVLVCGGRAFDDYAMVIRVLDRIHEATPVIHTLDLPPQARPGGITLLIHGDANGADRLGGQWAALRGVPVQAFPARWQEEGKAAGPLRNQRMLDEGKPDLVVGFPGGAGTRDMLVRAERADVLRYELPTRFVVDAGEVTSRYDGQRHSIGPVRLAYLYGVPLNRVVNAADTTGRGKRWPGNWPVLTPRYDGNYAAAKGLEDP